MKKFVSVVMVFVMLFSFCYALGFADEADSLTIESSDDSRPPQYRDVAVYTDAWRNIGSKASYDRNLYMANTGLFSIYLEMYVYSWSTTYPIWTDILAPGDSRTYFVGNDVDLVRIKALVGPTTAFISWQ